jgi:hypothetical protein
MGRLRGWITSRSADRWPYVVLTALLAYIFRDPLRGRGHFPYDAEFYHYPLLRSVADTLSSGSLPTWDPSTYAGVPLLSNAQAAWAYPPHLLIDLALWVTGRDWSEGLLQGVEVFHIWVAAIGTCLLVRRRGLGNAAALFAGGFIAFNGSSVSQVQHTGVVEMFAWLPWCLVAMESMKAGVTPRRVAALGGCFSLVVTAGFTPFLLPCVALLATYGLVQARGRLTAVAGAWGGLALGGAIAAAAVLPLLAILPMYPPIAEHSSLPSDWLLTTIVPNAFGHWSDSPAAYTGGFGLTSSYMYIGALAAVALPLALASSRRVAPDALIALALLLLTYGHPGGYVARLLHEHFELTKALYRPELVGNVAMLPLALALAHAFAKVPQRRQLVALLVFIGALLVVPLPNRLGPTLHFLTDAPRRDVLVVLGTGALAGWALLRPVKEVTARRVIVAVTLTGITALALCVPGRFFIVNPGAATTAGPTTTGDGSPVLSFVRDALRPGERVLSDSEHLPPAWNGFSPVWRLPNANGFQPQFSKYLKERITRLSAPFDRLLPVTPALSPVLRELNVRLVIVSTAADPFAGRPKDPIIYQDGQYTVHRLAGENVRAYELEPACAGTPAAAEHARCRGRPVTVTLPSASTRRLVLADARGHREVVSGEPYYPGWTASAGDRDLTVHRSGYLTTVDVPDGVSRIELSYHPPLLRVGLALSLLALLAAAGMSRPRRTADGW